MNESKSSWNIEELVTQMEKMQAENSSLELLLNQKEEQIQLLSSEKSKLQSVLLTLKNQLQTKSDQIVKMKGADLILKENALLKEQDKKRLKELSETKQKATTTVQACKKDFQNHKIRLRQEYEDHYRNLKSEHKNVTIELKAKLMKSVICSVILTMLTAIKSDTFISDLIAFFIAIGDAVIDYPALIIAIISIIACLVKSGLLMLYKKKLSDSITFWLTTITLISTIFLADEIKNVLSINLIILNLICHFVYAGIRIYIDTSKEA